MSVWLHGGIASYSVSIVECNPSFMGVTIALSPAYQPHERRFKGKKLMSVTRNKSRQPAPVTSEGIPPDHIGVLIAAVVMFVAGWGGLYYLITTQIPRIGGQLWLFFVLLDIAVTATAIPFVRYLNIRFTPRTIELAPGGIIVRQSVWVGLYTVACAWLRIGRALTLLIMVLLALVFIVIEVFLRTREIANER